jgi:hypothetical protein
MTLTQILGLIIGGTVATFVSGFIACCLFVAVDSAFRRRWRFAGGALLFAALFSTVAVPLWMSVIRAGVHSPPVMPILSS